MLDGSGRDEEDVIPSDVWILLVNDMFDILAELLDVICIHDTRHTGAD